MSYIGRSVDAIDNISTLDNLSFNGSDATFNLTQNSVAFTPVSADALQIQIDGVIQANNFTISGSTLTFDFTPASGSVCNSIKHFGVGVLTTPSDGSVTTAKLGADSVNATKIADDSISDEHLDITAITGQTAITSLADTDKFLVSDASDSGNLKYVEKQYLPSGGLVHINTISITSSTASATFLHGTNSVVLNDGTYENFLIIGSGIQLSNDDDSIRVSFSIDNGSNYNAQTYRATDQVEMTQSGSSGSASQDAQSSAGASSIGGAVGNNLGNGFMFTMYLFNLNSVVVKKTALVEALEEQHNLIYKKRSSFITIAEYNAAIDGIRFNCNAGTFSKATFRLYGITNG